MLSRVVRSAARRTAVTRANALRIVSSCRSAAAAAVAVGAKAAVSRRGFTAVGLGAVAGRAVAATAATASGPPVAVVAAPPNSPYSGGAKLIRGSALAAEVHGAVERDVAAIKRASSDGRTGPKLAVILVGDRKDSQSYVLGKTKAARSVGIESVQLDLPQATTQAELHARIRALNADSSVNGILLQLPLPPHLNADHALNTIEPIKDVDGLTATNAGRLLKYGTASELLPCTPKGCITLLQRAEAESNGAFRIAGSNAAVLGRSELVGRPLSILLGALNATVTVCHSHTRDVGAVVRGADIVVAAIGKPHFVKAEWIKPGAVVVDVGINVVPDATKRTGQRLLGDVEWGASARAAFITPVPGGVGPMTVATLLQNTVTAYRLQHSDDHTLYRRKELH